MLTIRKKLEEQAASSSAGSSSDRGRGEGRRVRRRMSIRSQLLTEGKDLSQNPNLFGYRTKCLQQQGMVESLYKLNLLTDNLLGYR